MPVLGTVNPGQDQNQNYAIFGMSGTLGPTYGTAEARPLTATDNGYLNVNAAVTAVNTPGGTLDRIGSIDIIGTMPAISSNPASGTQQTLGTVGVVNNVVTGTLASVGTIPGVGTITNIGSISNIGTMPALSLALNTGTITTIAAGTLNTLGTVGVVNNVVTGTLASLGTVPGVGTITNIGSLSNIGVVPSHEVTLTSTTLTAGTINLGTVAVSALPSGGTLLNLAAGTLTSVGGLASGTINVGSVAVTSLPSGGTILNLAAGTLTALPAVSLNSSGTLLNLASGTLAAVTSVTNLAGGTVTSVLSQSAGTQNTLGTVGVVNNVVTGTLASLGTVPGIGTVTNIGTLSALNAGTVKVSAGTIVGTFAELTGSATAGTTDLIASTDVSNYRWASLQIFDTFVGTINIQPSNDNSNFPTNQSFITVNAQNNSPGANITAASIQYFPIDSRYIRIRMMAFTSGTAQAVLELYSIPSGNLNAGVTAAQVGGWNVGGTVSINTKQIGSTILTTQTQGTAGSAVWGTLIAPVGAGTYVYVTGLSAVVDAGTVDVAISTNVAGSTGAGVFARGQFTQAAGIAREYTYPIQVGTNGTIAYWLGGAGTVSMTVDYWVGV